MPASKLAVLRYTLIDQMLRDKTKPYPTKEELLKACQEKFGVESPSTLEKDLNAMRTDFDAPISYHVRHRGYHYTDPNYKLFAVSLTEKQKNALRFVETLLDEFRVLPIFNEFSEAIDKVLEGLEITRRFNERASQVNAFIQIDKSPYVKGQELLSQLIERISEDVVICFDYQKFNSDSPKTYTLHPYLLRQYKNLWYLTGYVEEYKEVRTFGIDRIKSLAVAEEVAYLPPSKVRFQAGHFFRHCIGITRNGNPQKIELSFTPVQANYVKAQPIHTSQQVLWENSEECRIGLELVINPELRNILLGFGAGVRVIRPKKLAEEMAEELRRALAAYE